MVHLNSEQSSNIIVLKNYHKLVQHLLKEKPSLGGQTLDQFEQEIKDFDEFFARNRSDLSLSIMKELLVFYNCKPVIDNWIKVHWYYIRTYFKDEGNQFSISPQIVSLIEHLNYENFRLLEFETTQKECFLETLLAKMLIHRAADVRESTTIQEAKMRRIVQCNMFCLQLYADTKEAVSVNIFQHARDPDTILQLFIDRGLFSEHFKTFSAHKHLFNEDKLGQIVKRCFDIDHLKIDLDKLLLVIDLISKEETKAELITDCVDALFAYLKDYKREAGTITAAPAFAERVLNALLCMLRDVVASFQPEKYEVIEDIALKFTACFEFLMELDNNTRSLLVLPKDLEDTRSVETILYDFIEKDELE